jgi:hypothetical protein
MSLAAVGVGIASYAGGATLGTAVLAAGGSYLASGALGGGATASSGATSRSKGTSEDLTIEQLQLEEEAVQNIANKVLGAGQGGLASILGTDRVAGIFDSTVSAQASGDLASKLIGEIAELTGQKKTAASGKTTKNVDEKKTESNVEDLLGNIGSAADLVSDVFAGSLGRNQ